MFFKEVFDLSELLNSICNALNSITLGSVNWQKGSYKIKWSRSVRTHQSFKIIKLQKLSSIRQPVITPQKLMPSQVLEFRLVLEIHGVEPRRNQVLKLRNWEWCHVLVKTYLKLYAHELL